MSSCIGKIEFSLLLLSVTLLLFEGKSYLSALSAAVQQDNNLCCSVWRGSSIMPRIWTVALSFGVLSGNIPAKNTQICRVQCNRISGSSLQIPSSGFQIHRRRWAPSATGCMASEWVIQWLVWRVYVLHTKAPLWRHFRCNSECSRGTISEL